MKALPSSVRSEVSQKDDDVILLDPDSPQPTEKTRLFKEIVMNGGGEVQDNAKVAKIDTTLNGHMSPSGSENASSAESEAASEGVKQNGHLEGECVMNVVENNEVDKTNGVEVSEKEKVEDEGSKTEEQHDLNAKDLDSEKPEDVPSSAADGDCASNTGSSNDDEEIRLVLDDALDEIGREEKEASQSAMDVEEPTQETDAAEESFETATEGEDKEEKELDAQAPATPLGDVCLENITDNFDDSNNSFDKVLSPAEKTDQEESQAKPKAAESQCDDKPDDAQKEVIKIVDEPKEEVARKRSSDSDIALVEPKKLKVEHSEDKKDVKIDIKHESNESKLLSAVKSMTRQDLEKFLIDTFLVNMTRKSRMAVQEQEILKLKNKCELYKKKIASVMKLCTDLKNGVEQIAVANKTGAMIQKPKTIVRHVAIQVPSKVLAAASQPEKKLRTLPPVQRIQNNMTKSTTTVVTRVNSLVRNPGPGQRQIIVQKTANSPNLLATLKSPPKVAPPGLNPMVQQTLKTTDSPVQLVQSGRIYLPTSTGIQGNKPVAYLISNSQTRPVLMQSNMGGLLINKQQNNSSNTILTTSGRNTIMSQRAIHAPMQQNVVGNRQTYSTPGRKVQNKINHPAPIPPVGQQPIRQGWKALPPKPTLKIQAAAKGIMLSWHLPSYGSEHEEIKSYQIYAYQETVEEPSSKLWKTVGDVKALALPMACTLTQFKEGHKYHFAVRAVDIHNRLGPNSDTMSIILHKSHD